MLSSAPLLPLLLALAAGPAAPSGADPPSSTTAGPAPSLRATPRTAGALPMETRFWLGAAFRLALGRLEEEPGCRALFAQFETDGRTLLGAALFRPPRTAAERRICQTAAAFTRVGSSETALCPRLFRALRQERAAAVLIHETLHHAGRTEAPADPDAPTSKEITRTVEERCRLGPGRSRPARRARG